MIEKLKQINFPISQLFDNKKVAVFLTAFNRPENLKKVVQSINLSDELENIPFFIYLDGGAAAKQEECTEIVKQIKFKNKYLIKRSVNLGCDRNTFEMFNDMFVHLNFDYAFHIEDDFVFCKNYFKYCFDEFKRIKADIDPNIGVFQGFSLCLLTPAQKKDRINDVVATENDHLWGCLYSKESYYQIKETLKEYESIISTFPTNGNSKNYMLQIMNAVIAPCYNQIIDNSKNIIPEHMKSMLYNKTKEHFTAGWDGAFGLAMASNAIKRYMSVVNRMINIGETGHHYSPVAFKQMKLDKITLDEVWDGK